MRPVFGHVAALVAVILSAACALTGCGPSVIPSPSARGGSPSASAVSPTQGATAGDAPSPGATGAIAIDKTLLDVLPASVDGLPMTESPEAEASAFGDPQLARVGTAIVAGIAVDGTTGEFAYAAVVRLKPGAMNDTVFRDWRDSYDEGACSQANGVSGNAQAQMDGRTVYIGTCAGGVRTYHVWLEAQLLLVSASAVGDRRLGEILMNTLHVP